MTNNKRKIILLKDLEKELQGGRTNEKGEIFCCGRYMSKDEYKKHMKSHMVCIGE